MPASDLFTIDEFASYMKESVDTSSAVVARRVASGWALDAAGLTDWVLPISDSLFGWTLELAAISWRNPDGAASESVDDHSVTWDRQRRNDILRAVQAQFGTGDTPQFSFPDPDWHWVPVPILPPNTALTF
jgi:hypothetical protein